MNKLFTRCGKLVHRVLYNSVEKAGVDHPQAVHTTARQGLISSVLHKTYGFSTNVFTALQHLYPHQNPPPFLGCLGRLYTYPQSLLLLRLYK